MGSRGLVRMSEIHAMLDSCAPGWSMKTKLHKNWVYWNKNSFKLPLGKHGARTNPEIEIGHVRSLVRHLTIDVGCARKTIPLIASQ